MRDRLRSLRCAAACAAAAALLDPARASAAPPPHALVLEAPPHASARLGAVRLRVAVRNVSEETVEAAADPARLRVAVRDAAGRRLRCAGAPAGGRAAAIAPGRRAQLVVDLGVRCGLAATGAYTVDVAYDGPAGRTVEARVALRVTRWVNPGPLSPGQGPPFDSAQGERRPGPE
jgi:hypothetical protein